MLGAATTRRKIGLIIGEGSPLRRLPANLDRKQMLFLDGIRYSVNMADLAYSRLQQTLYRLSMNQQHYEGFDLDILSAVQDAWSIVDSFHRLRGLIRQTPGFKQKSPEMRVFMQHTEKVEDLRNAVQHLNHEIDKLVGANQTVWGSVSWFAVSDPSSKSGQIGLLVAGTVVTSEGHPMVNPVGKPLHSLVDLVTLTAYGHSLNLSNAMRHVERRIESLEDQLKDQFAGLPVAGSELLLVATLE